MSNDHSSGNGRRRPHGDQRVYHESPGYGDDDVTTHTAVRHPSDRSSRGSPSAAMFVDQWAHGDSNGSRRPLEVRRCWIGPEFSTSRPIGDGVPPQRGHRQNSGNQQGANRRDASYQRPSDPGSPQQPRQSPVSNAEGAGDMNNNKQLVVRTQAPRLHQTGYALRSRYPNSDNNPSLDYVLEQLERELQAAARFYGAYIEAHAKQLAKAADAGCNRDVLNMIWVQVVSAKINNDVNETGRFHDTCAAIQEKLKTIKDLSTPLDEANWDKPGGALESAMSKQRRVGLKMLVVLVQGITMTAQTVQRERTSCLAVYNMIEQALAMLDQKKGDNLYLYKKYDKGDAVSLDNRAETEQEENDEANESSNGWKATE
ncbi:hypothetical protein MGG_01213 [Pyricularia oryzae 70-15]|uniref:Uncharacterized protein n=3 Tax=Pyricularia oryzae TaxID=318829 RepID=G4MX08_PYRO7|nr:uncharacterized protein MGG_01213 [Pyricularia oryzae 70-15]EHA54300.1 hypothetical protein MGG_01213 [Pyricularia oryzae 70-15]ELQ43019.1 hypothetical protein OOU_Y34scaffold00177g31 [Pyricularia oryzae Y34]KAI7923859.1 hypothetical protein M9X92_004154 [Pyricularia oryzae]KAI7929542.1 hypothetical protein M0657_002220 [Pyricularia oryzae]